MLSLVKKVVLLCLKRYCIMSRKRKRSLKERLIGLVVVLVVAGGFAFRRSLDSEKEIVKPANKTVLAEKSDTKAESEILQRRRFRLVFGRR